MNKEEKDRILNKVTPLCHICKAIVAREDMSLETSIVLLKKHPVHVGPEFTHYYMVCPKCKTKGELI